MKSNKYFRYLCAKRCSEFSTLELLGSSAVHFLFGSGELVSSRNCLREHWLVITGSKAYRLNWIQLQWTSVVVTP